MAIHNSDVDRQKPLDTSYSLLRDRNFMLLWLGQLISNVGDAALLIAVPVAVYNATNSRGALSLVTIAAALPTLLLGMFAGVFVDRWNRKRTMIVSDLARMCGVLLMLGVRGPDQIWLFYVATFVIAAFSCFFSPARFAVIRILFPKERLLRANALMSSGMQITSLIGPALGGLLLAMVGRQVVFIVDAGTFIVSALCIAMIRMPAAPVGAPARMFDGVWRDMVAGVRFVISQPILTGMISLLGIIAIGAEISNTLEYAFVRDVWHSGRLFGYLMSGFGLGMVVAGLLVSGPLRNFDPKRLMHIGLAVLTAGGFGWAMSPNAIWGAVALFVFGLGNVLLNIPMYTLFQTSTPPAMMGRVTATVTVATRVSMLIAGGLAAALMNLPLQPIFIGLACVYLLSAVLARPLMARKKRDVSGVDMLEKQGELIDA